MISKIYRWSLLFFVGKCKKKHEINAKPMFSITNMHYFIALDCKKMHWDRNHKKNLHFNVIKSMTI